MTRVVLTLARPAQREVTRRALYIAALQGTGAQTERHGNPESHPCAASVEVVPLFPGELEPDDFDGLVLSGGGDVHPSRYGAEDAGSANIDEERDSLEFTVLDHAIRRRRPVLGICRGMQLLNVALGGQLTQHLGGHDPQRGEVKRHEVVIAPSSLLEAACGRGPLRVNSWHHQGVRPRDLARGLRATAVVDDLVEAFEAPHLGWVVGVQWHPERTAEVDAEATRIFDAFLAAARGDAVAPR